VSKTLQVKAICKEVAQALTLQVKAICKEVAQALCCGIQLRTDSFSIKATESASDDLLNFFVTTHS